MTMTAENLPRYLQNHGLTPRETEVCLHLMRGLTGKQIAHLLSVTEKTIKFHASTCYKKLKMKNRINLIIYIATHFPEFYQQDWSYERAEIENTGLPQGHRFFKGSHH